jgi:threonine/homoserine/homoserine lactone efflux protein
MISEFIPAILLGIVLSFTIGPVFFTILEISVSKGFKAAVFFNIGVVFSELVFFAVAYASTSNLLNSIQENPSWKILGGVLLAFYAGITLLGMYQNKEKKEQQNLFKSPPPSPNLIKNLIKGFGLNIINFAVLVFWILIVANYAPGFQDSQYKMIVFFLVIVGTYFTIDLGKIYLAQQLKTSLTDSVITKIKLIVNVIILIIGLVLIFEGFFE